ncbi:isochorismatase family protein [Virgibacillus sp. 179-BFC.A HS]|uniref:Isochorismatase family protein n=1 Tax=Tigheibacillus jepli TaxID=3035914 RepID=A0ABU5CF02_9BACI|nr:isochorismatase family protein [Virgibacillus sp. 179-BFC.A HS]MDY0404414.1 isochorismatase family protein [Virgibacillus sp. 179-BFC.A HS]
MNEDPDSPLYKEATGAALYSSVSEYAETVIQKKTPSAFFQTDLHETLKRMGQTTCILPGFRRNFAALYRHCSV